MADWLKQNFLRVGVMALAADLFALLYNRVILGWLREARGLAGATFAELMSYAYVATALDFVATLLWGLFTLGFAIRVVAGLQSLDR